MTVWRFSRWPEWGAYDVCVLDPPWSFRTYSNKTILKCPSHHYAVQSLNDIIDLPVRAWTAPDAWVCLWATNPMLPQALEVLAAWGVTYSTMLTWNKVRPSGALSFGTGYVLRSSTEPLLIGRIGRPRVRSEDRTAPRPTRQRRCRDRAAASRRSRLGATDQGGSCRGA